MTTYIILYLFLYLFQLMAFWDVVHFLNDNSVEAVPHIWFKNKTCAWPKDPKQIKKFIEKRKIPNEKEFVFYPARKFKEKSYESLSEARSKSIKAVHNSDLSTTEDDRVKNKRLRRRKCLSLSPNLKKKISKSSHNITADTFPPRYRLKKEHVTPEKSELKVKDYEDNSSADDSDKDSTWKPITNSVVFDKISDNDDSEDDSAGKKYLPPGEKFSYRRYGSNSDLLSSPASDNIKIVSDTNKINTSDHEIQFINTSNGKWSVEKDDDTSMIFQKSIDGNSMRIKRVLFANDEDNNSKKSDSTTSNLIKEKLDSGNSAINDNNSIRLKETDNDFQKFVMNNLINLKYEIGLMSNMVRSNYTNIEALMNISNKNLNSTSSCNDKFNIDQILPVKSESELKALEDNLKIDDFKTSMVTKLSVLINNNDLGNSVRRVVGRMFNDNILSYYSLFGFKQKLSFSSLLSYRVIIDSIRKSVKYNNVPEKDIDNCLGTWLSHAPFRIKKKRSKKSQMIIIVIKNVLIFWPNLYMVGINIEDKKDSEMNAIARKLKEKYKRNATAAAKQKAAPPATNKTSNQEIMTNNCVYIESIKGRFAWELIGGCDIPYIVRVINAVPEAVPAIVPYCSIDGNKFVPIFYFEGDTERLIPLAVKLGNWNLAYVKFCCYFVQVLKNEFLDSVSWEMSSNRVNPLGVWFRTSLDVLPAEITIPRRNRSIAPQCNNTGYSYTIQPQPQTQPENQSPSTFNNYLLARRNRRLFIYHSATAPDSA
eukprot:XP_016660291.1 PREDICTED: uncharacterized protein LOC107883888 [Acyrthosiphon pisum]